MYCSPQTQSCQVPFCAGDGCYSPTGCLYPSQCANFLGGQGTCTVVGSAAETGEMCDPNDGCAELADYCNTTTMMCTPLAAVGSACGSDAPCVPYAACSAGSSGGSGTCMACPDDTCSAM